ncbi:unnamed protein product [Staurois parvus]|uniref:Uncharacterized protein n=1 Tax=Staurois parvus TaxID=386267 RepID=A0ABN9ER45_9NEOB|nr:unnamed protein product [Staurois parvus]
MYQALLWTFLRIFPEHQLNTIWTTSVVKFLAKSSVTVLTPGQKISVPSSGVNSKRIKPATPKMAAFPGLMGHPVGIAAFAGMESVWKMRMFLNQRVPLDGNWGLGVPGANAHGAVEGVYVFPIEIVTIQNLRMVASTAKAREPSTNHATPRSAPCRVGILPSTCFLLTYYPKVQLNPKLIFLSPVIVCT